MDQSCPIPPPDLSHIEVISLSPENIIKDYQEDVTLAKELADKHFEEYILVSWYDREISSHHPILLKGQGIAKRMGISTSA